MELVGCDFLEAYPWVNTHKGLVLWLKEGEGRVSLEGIGKGGFKMDQRETVVLSAPLLHRKNTRQ